MYMLKKCFIGFIAVSLVGLYFPKVQMCHASEAGSKSDKKSITHHKPQIKAAPEENLTPEIMAGEKKGPNWMMIGLGVVVLGGLAAAMGGGGGGGDDSAQGDGSVSVNW